MLERLGSDGMSSDESAVEDNIEIVYRVKRLPWRRSIEKELDLIDAQRIRQPNPFGKQGSKPVRRFRHPAYPASTRKAVEGLPKAFYDEQWLLERDKRQKRMAISSEKFNWLSIV